MKRVLILHTGGTLGMEGSPLQPGAFGARLLDHVPELSRLASVDVRIVCNLDSSDIGHRQWQALARIIAAERTDWDGFVVIHGTDTMAFTAGALAMTLRGLDRPVILTGAQRPLAALRNDARRNLADAVAVATQPIPEVTICFDGLLLRGCRAIKDDARSYRAFASPGVPPLATLGTDIALGPHIYWVMGPFHCNPVFNPAVDLIYVLPQLSPERLDHRLQDPSLQGVVLAALGSGTLPSNGVIDVVSRAVERGVEVLVVTQWGGRTNLALYENSRPLLDAGATDGGAMRIPAAVPKLMHGLAAFTDANARRRYLQTDIAGEYR